MLAEHIGAIALASPQFKFDATEYYQAQMGSPLIKQFFAFDQLVDPGVLPEVKNQTDAWEHEYAKAANHDVQRPINLDPGYITEAKFVLASTKNRAHRLYLGDGVFGEMTLQYKAHRWQAAEWTYEDYRRDDYHQFFTQCRDLLRQKLGRG